MKFGNLFAAFVSASRRIRRLVLYSSRLGIMRMMQILYECRENNNNVSKIGKKPIIIPEGVDVKIIDGILEFKGRDGELKLKILPYVATEIKDGQIFFSIQNNFKQARANWGTMRSLAQNALKGVIGGFVKSLEIKGIGYRAEMRGNDLILNVGLSHPVTITPPDGIRISVEKNIIKISGIDKILVGKTAAKIRAVKKPEPYKGKGIRYQDEIIKRKAGKKAAGISA